MLDAVSGREVHRLDGDKPGWHPVAVSADGALIASGGTDGVVRLWDVKAEREKAVLRGHTDKLQRCSLLADTPPPRLDVLGQDRPSLGRRHRAEVRRFEGHTDFVDGLKFKPDGRQIVTASWDRTVRIWDVATGHEARKLETSGDVLERPRSVEDGSRHLLRRKGRAAALVAACLEPRAGRRQHLHRLRVGLCPAARRAPCPGLRQGCGRTVGLQDRAPGSSPGEAHRATSPALRLHPTDVALRPVAKTRPSRSGTCPTWDTSHPGGRFPPAGLSDPCATRSEEHLALQLGSMVTNADIARPVCVVMSIPAMP